MGIFNITPETCEVALEYKFDIHKYEVHVLSGISRPLLTEWLKNSITIKEFATHIFDWLKASGIPIPRAFIKCWYDKPSDCLFLYFCLKLRRGGIPNRRKILKILDYGKCGGEEIYMSENPVLILDDRDEVRIDIG